LSENDGLIAQMKEMKEKYGKVDSEMEEVYEALNKLQSEAKNAQFR
jgi:formiminotetrahydrofolate cyclodeaminase